MVGCLTSAFKGNLQHCEIVLIKGLNLSEAVLVSATDDSNVVTLLPRFFLGAFVDCKEDA